MIEMEFSDLNDDNGQWNRSLMFNFFPVAMVQRIQVILHSFVEEGPNVRV